MNDAGIRLHSKPHAKAVCVSGKKAAHHCRSNTSGGSMECRPGLPMHKRIHRLTIGGDMCRFPMLRMTAFLKTAL